MKVLPGRDPENLFYIWRAAPAEFTIDIARALIDLRLYIVLGAAGGWRRHMKFAKMSMKFAKMSTMATFILRQYREVVGVALQLRGNALMVQRAVGDIGNESDVS